MQKLKREQLTGKPERLLLRTLLRNAPVSMVLLCASASLLIPAAYSQSAATWSKRGADAEVREDYDAAFEAYRQAHLLKPNDLRYKTHFERARFSAGAAHVDRGRVLRQSGDINGALVEFERALAIDGSNQAAQQEITVTERLLNATPGSSLDRPGWPLTGNRLHSRAVEAEACLDRSHHAASG